MANLAFARRALPMALALAGALSTSAAPSAAATPTATTSPYQASINDIVCAHTAGKYGHGKLQANAGFREVGMSGTNYFRSLVQVQRRNNGVWEAWNPVARATSNPFPDNDANYTWNQAWKYSFQADEVGQRFRLLLTFKFYDQRSGADKLLKTITRHSPSCTP